MEAAVVAVRVVLVVPVAAVPVVDAVDVVAVPLAHSVVLVVLLERGASPSGRSVTSMRQCRHHRSLAA